MAAPRAPLLPLVAALAAGIALGPVVTVPPARLIGLAAALLALGLLPLGFSDIALRRLARRASQAGPEARAESPAGLEGPRGSVVPVVRAGGGGQAACRAAVSLPLRCASGSHRPSGRWRL